MPSMKRFVSLAVVATLFAAATPANAQRRGGGSGGGGGSRGATAGRAVFFSGLTVLLGLAGLVALAITGVVFARRRMRA